MQNQSPSPTDEKPKTADVLGGFGILFVLFMLLVFGVRACTSALSGPGSSTSCQEKGYAAFYAVNNRMPTAKEGGDITRMCIDNPGAFGS